jgi:hypothetical protein
MMTSIYLTSKNEVALARELAGKIGQSLSVEGDRLTLDAEDAGDVVAMMADADRYYRSIRKPGMAKAAANIREAAYDIDSTARRLMLADMGRGF